MATSPLGLNSGLVRKRGGSSDSAHGLDSLAGGRPDSIVTSPSSAGRSRPAWEQTHTASPFSRETWRLPASPPATVDDSKADTRVIGPPAARKVSPADPAAPWVLPPAVKPPAPWGPVDAPALPPPLKPVRVPDHLVPLALVPAELVPLTLAPAADDLVPLVLAPAAKPAPKPGPSAAPIRVKLDRSRWKAMAGSVPPTVMWLGLAFLLYWTVPDRAWWTLKFEATMVCLGTIGTFRYAWLLVNAARAYYFRYRYFPTVRAAAEALPDDLKYPPQLCFVIASYKEEEAVTRICFATIAAELRDVPSEVHVIVSVGSEPEAKLIGEVMRDCGATRVKLHFTLQSQGKRKALAHALRVARQVTAATPDNVIVLMDGDSGLGEGCLRATLPLFRQNPRLGAVTVDNEAVFLGPVPEVVQRWYAVKFMKRHHMMMSHALSHRVMTLTGRFSVYRSSAVLCDEAIYRLENDAIEHWVHGKIKFLMGDDKSTMFTLLRNGWEMGYAPDAFVVCLETRSGNFVEVIRSLMIRWYGNMLRTNGRSIALGTKVMPFFSWLCFVDQRINPWTTMTGPAGALLLSVFVSPYYAVFYAVWVILTRLGQLWLTAIVHGHKMWWLDVPLQLLEQWYGSAVKIYCLFHLNRQKWSKKGTTSAHKEADDRPWMSRRVGPLVFGLNLTAFVVVVLLLTGLLKLPPLL